MHTFAWMLLLLPAAPVEKLVVFAGKMSDSQLISLGAAVAVRPDATLLLDSPEESIYLRHFLSAYRADQVWPVGTFTESKSTLEKRLGVKVDTPLTCADAIEKLAPVAKGVVVCRTEPRALLLMAGALASARGLQLRVCDDSPTLRKIVTREIVAVGSYPSLRKGLARTTKLVSLANSRLVEAAHLEALGNKIETAVVVNPTTPGLSGLAPWLAGLKRAAVLFTNAKGDDVAAVVERAVRKRALRRLETIILLADLKAIPTLSRPNPIATDKDKVIDLEPLTPTGNDPFSYAVGRLFHPDRAVVPLMLARQKLMAERTGPPRVLIASNPGGGLPLLETFSRCTAQELTHTGHKVTALFSKELTASSLRKQMADKELILWEGHHNTLVKDWGFVEWKEPMAPSFVFLQSCLALMEPKVQPLLSRGAVGVLGTSTRTYSGSGGAFSLAYLDAVAYEGRSMGEALRQAKNFLVVYSMLKKQRLGEQAKRLGANQRASWAFTLWGDPTFHLPRPAAAPRSAVKTTVNGNTITLELPSTWHRTPETPKYQVHLPANARLAGLVRKQDEKRPTLVPLVFAEVHLPKAPSGVVPRLKSRLPSNNYVFNWDARRKVGYLLALPRASDKIELRFRIEWPESSVARGE